MRYPATTLPPEVPGGVREKISPDAAHNSKYLPLLESIYSLPGENRRSVSMEGLRGLAVLLVFFVHYHALFADYGRSVPLLWVPSQFWGYIGNAGVDLFFAISGYLIYKALLRSTISTFGFLWRRVVRLYPTFLTVFALYMLLSVMFPNLSRFQALSQGEGWIYLLQNLLFLPGIFTIKPIITLAWSLSYEAFFYLLAVLLVRSMRMWKWRESARIGFVAVLALGYLAICFATTESRVRMLMFAVGILLYEALLSKRFSRFLTPRGEIAASAMFVVALATTYVMEVRPQVFSFLPGWTAGRNAVPGVLVYQGPYKTILLSISTFWFVAYTLGHEGLLRRAFAWRPLRYLGNMSYSYYLIHGVTLQGVALIWGVLAGRGLSGPLLFAAALPLGFAATWISATVLFFLIEKPISLRPQPVLGSGPKTGKGVRG